MKRNDMEKGVSSKKKRPVMRRFQNLFYIRHFGHVIKLNEFLVELE